VTEGNNEWSEGRGSDHGPRVGRLHGTAGTVWLLTAIDTYSSFAWAELVTSTDYGVVAEHTSRLARRVAKDLQAAGWQLERMLSDNGNEFGSRVFTDTIATLGARHGRIRSGHPQINGHVERLHRTILEECWRPVFARFLQVRFTGLQRELARYLDYYNHQRAHTGRITAGDARPNSSTVPAKWSRDEPHASAHPGVRSPAQISYPRNGASQPNSSVGDLALGWAVRREPRAGQRHFLVRVEFVRDRRRPLSRSTPIGSRRPHRDPDQRQIVEKCGPAIHFDQRIS
jgi:hypothetical protein